MNKNAMEPAKPVLNTADGFDMMQRMVPIAARIIEDADAKEVRNMITEKHSGADIARALCPLMLAKHRAEVLELVAAMQGKTADEVAMQPIDKTLETLSEGVKLYASFFPACVRLVANA